MAEKNKQKADQTKKATRQGQQPAAENLAAAPAFEMLDLQTLQRAVADPAQAGPEAILALQQTAGNRAVSRLIELKTSVQRMGPEGGQVSPGVEATIQQARQGGQSLDPAIQSDMSQTMGFDFSAVRVHADHQADDLNQHLSARAFTTGNDVFFRQGEYNPGSSAGQDVIAHELVHVVQQNTGRVSGSGSGMTVRPAGDSFEQEADGITEQHPSGVQRKNLKSIVQRWNPQGHRVITAKALKDRAIKARFDKAAMEILEDRSPDMDYIQDQQEKMGQGIAESDGNITIYKIRAQQYAVKKDPTIKSELDKMWRENALHRRDPNYMRLHGEGGLYQKDAAEAAGVNKAVTTELVNKAVGLYSAGNSSEGIEILSDAVHQAEDRGAHGEGAQGLGHDARQKILMAERTPDHRAAFERVPLINDVYPLPDNSDVNKAGAEVALQYAQDVLLQFTSKIPGGTISATPTLKRHAIIANVETNSKGWATSLAENVLPWSPIFKNKTMSAYTGGHVNSLEPTEGRATPTDTPSTAESQSTLNYYLESQEQQKERDLARSKFLEWQKPWLLGGLSKAQRITQSKNYYKQKLDPLQEMAKSVAQAILKAYWDEFKENLEADPKLKASASPDQNEYRMAKQQFLVWHRWQIGKLFNLPGGLPEQERKKQSLEYYQKRVTIWLQKAESIAAAIKGVYTLVFKEPAAILE